MHHNALNITAIVIATAVASMIVCSPLNRADYPTFTIDHRYNCRYKGSHKCRAYIVTQLDMNDIQTKNEHTCRPPRDNSNPDLYISELPPRAL